MAPTLTEDDLDALGTDIARADDPRPALDELVSAVDDGRLADPDTASYALTLAASAAAKLHEPDEALALSRRSVALAEGREKNSARGDLAELLLRFGHEEEGMAELRALRPQLSREIHAVYYVVEPLEENGRSELAEEWLSAALATALDIAERTDPDSDEGDEAWEIVERLTVVRRRVRRGLGLAPDEADAMAEQLIEDGPAPERIFWPRMAFDALLQAFPDDVATTLGATWDEHRARIERALAEPGDDVVVEVATPELLAATLDPEGDPGTVGAAPLLDWPPGRNDPCWCTSGVKYKKCCLPRGRD